MRSFEVAELEDYVEINEKCFLLHLQSAKDSVASTAKHLVDPRV